MSRFADKVIVVTGAASGIGRASTELFADEQAIVAAVNHDRGASDIGRILRRQK